MRMEKAKLPLMAMHEVPEPRTDAERIVALVRDNGRITGYRLSGGRTVGKSEGVALARAGGIQGVGIALRNGSEYLKSIPDGTEGNNLSNLPSVTENR